MKFTACYRLLIGGFKKGKIMSKKMYFKVYQDRKSVEYAYYVETKEGLEESLKCWEDDHIENDMAMPVIEPILMTEEEFENLPEFVGF